MWRIENGLHNKITYSFMVAGHTKFSPDGFFGLFKLKLRNSEVENLEDLVKVVEKSSLKGIIQHKLFLMVVEQERFISISGQSF